MKTDLKRKSDLTRAMRDDSFVLKTKQQLIKDFAKVNIKFPNNFEFDITDRLEIERLVANEVVTLMERSERHLLQLLYVVDLSEKVFLKLTTQSDFLAKIAEHILYREAYKVWLRANYSN